MFDPIPPAVVGLSDQMQATLDAMPESTKLLLVQYNQDELISSIKQIFEQLLPAVMPYMIEPDKSYLIADAQQAMRWLAVNCLLLSNVTRPQFEALLNADGTATDVAKATAVAVDLEKLSSQLDQLFDQISDVLP